MQLALFDELQQGVALLPANHVVIYFKLLLGFAQALGPFQLFLQQQATLCPCCNNSQ